MIKGQKKFELAMWSRYGNVCEPKDGWQRLAADVFEDFGLRALIRQALTEAKNQGSDIFSRVEQIVREKTERGEGLPNWPWQVKTTQEYFSQLLERAKRILTAWYGLGDVAPETVAEIAARENLDQDRVFQIVKVFLKQLKRKLKYIKPRLATWSDVLTQVHDYRQACDDLQMTITSYNRQIMELERVKSDFEDLKTHLRAINYIVSAPEPGEILFEEIPSGDESNDRRLDWLINDLELSVRTFNCLIREGWTTVRELVSHNEREFLEIKNFGGKSLTEVKEKLAYLGLKIPPWPSDEDVADDDEM